MGTPVRTVVIGSGCSLRIDPMDDAFAVGRLQPLRGLDGDVESVFDA